MINIFCVFILIIILLLNFENLFINFKNFLYAKKLEKLFFLKNIY